MSAFKQKLARIGTSAGLLAVCTAAILAVGGASASSAFAECKGVNIKGKGSSLQKIAQENWIAGFAAECPGGPAVTYTSTSSGDAGRLLVDQPFHVGELEERWHVECTQPL